MHPVAEEYTRQAAYCEEMADSSASREVKAEWLRLAGNWLAMVPYRESSVLYREPALQEDFGAIVHETPTRREESLSSNDRPSSQ